jgi:hypothetical protein
MFGFWNYVGVIEFEAPGLDEGTQRLQMVGIGKRDDTPNQVSIVVNFDKNNQGAPTSYSNNGGQVSPLVLPSVNRIATWIEQALAVDNYGVPTYAVQNSGSSWGTRVFGRYTTDAVLSPRTRTIQVRVFPPQLLGADGCESAVNGGGKSLSDNEREGNSIDYRQFPNLQAIFFNEAFITGVGTHIPKTVKRLILRECPNLTSLPTLLPGTSMEFVQLAEQTNSVMAGANVMLAPATNLKYLHFVTVSPYPTSVGSAAQINGNLDISFTSVLEQLFISNQTANFSGITFHGSLTTLKHFMLASSTTSFSTTIYDTVLTNNPNLESFIINSNTGTANWNKTFDLTTVPHSVLRWFWMYNTRAIGNIDFSNSAFSTLKEIRLGNNTTTTANTSAHQIVDLTGATGLVYLDMSGVDCEDLELPNAPALTTLTLYDNKLDVLTNPNLLTQVNALTAVTTCRFSVFQTSAVSANHAGQTSVNGLGTNPSLSGLINATEIFVANCKIVGTLTIPNVNKLINFNVAFNTGMTSITNFNAHTGMQQFVAHGCTSLVFSIPNTFTALNNLRANNTLITTVDYSGKTSTTVGFSMVVTNCPNLTAITFPTAQNRCAIATASGQVMQVTNNPSLTTLTNVDNLNWSITGSTNNIIDFRNCILNMTFPLGNNNFIPSQAFLQDNGMSVANVDATIDSLYTNKAKWSVYTTPTKTLNIGGTNASPTGIYQAPVGFVLGVSDGTPASQKEKLYVLVNNYNWVVTYS